MKLSSLIAATLAVASIGMATSVVAHQEPSAQPQMYMQHPTRMHVQQSKFSRMLKSLDLTSTQQQQIKELMQQYKAERNNKNVNQQQYGANKEAMQQLMQAEYFDQALAEQLIQQRQTLQLQRQVQRLKLQHEVLQLLTPEQRLQLSQAAAHKRQSKRK